MTTIENLYYGNICPADHTLDGQEEARALILRIEKYKEQIILEPLSASQRKALNDCEEALAELSALFEKKMFIKGFQIGHAIAMESQMTARE